MPPRRCGRRRAPPWLRRLDACGNPSSVHAEGRAARRLIEEAREQVAALVGAEPRNVVFTSGGTEANVLALSPAASADAAGRCERLLVSAIEHPSVLAGGRFAAAAVERLPVDRRGAGRSCGARAPARRACQRRTAAAGVADARQQRDRRRSAGRRGGCTWCMRRAACCTSTRSRRPGESPAISMRSAPIF